MLLRNIRALRQAIGNAHGIHYFSQIEQIQYEFNVKIGEKLIKELSNKLKQVEMEVRDAFKELEEKAEE